MRRHINPVRQRPRLRLRDGIVVASHHRGQQVDVQQVRIALRTWVFGEFRLLCPLRHLHDPRCHDPGRPHIGNRAQSSESGCAAVNLGDLSITVADRVRQRRRRTATPEQHQVRLADMQATKPSGGYNANVLIVLYLPRTATVPSARYRCPATTTWIYPGCPSGVCKGNIKQAYGLAYQQTMDSAERQHLQLLSLEQTAREAGRKAEISTVRNLSGIPIDHFIEVTLVAFFQIAQVMQPITVCLNEDTSDSYSGADFHQGRLADRRRPGDGVRAAAPRQNDQMFTDLDRTRRQQAFIVSLVSPRCATGIAVQSQRICANCSRSPGRTSPWAHLRHLKAAKQVGF